MPCVDQRSSRQTLERHWNIRTQQHLQFHASQPSVQTVACHLLRNSPPQHQRSAKSGEHGPPKSVVQLQGHGDSASRAQSFRKQHKLDDKQINRQKKNFDGDAQHHLQLRRPHLRFSVQQLVLLKHHATTVGLRPYWLVESTFGWYIPKFYRVPLQQEQVFFLPILVGSIWTTSLLLQLRDPPGTSLRCHHNARNYPRTRPTPQGTHTVASLKPNTKHIAK